MYVVVRILSCIEHCNYCWYSILGAHAIAESPAKVLLFLIHQYNLECVGNWDVNKDGQIQVSDMTALTICIFFILQTPVRLSASEFVT